MIYYLVTRHHYVLKFIVCMKLMIFLTCICLHVSANVYPQKVSLNLKSVALKSVLKEIETQTEVRFVYSSEFLKDKTTINVDVKEQPVESVLNKVLSGTEFSYSKSNDQLYVISPIQDLVITGIVINEIGEPLSGATIHLKQSNSVTSTDADGKFTLKIPSSGGVLTVTYLGYVIYSIQVSTNQNLVIQLQPNDDNNLDEVVVVGYGTQKKATVTGSVAQVSGKEIVKSPVANISNSLQGRLPGLQFRQTSSEPGGDAANINIRGLGNALTIVDGVPTDINQINPNDIESISILKDGAAAMYGFRAANGAIIITTKRGNLTKHIFSLDAYAGYQANAVLYPQLLNAGQFTELMNESTINSANANSPTAVLPTLPFQKEEVEKWKQGTLPGYENTDWYNLVFNDYAPQNSVNLSIRGGSESAKYFISGGHLSQKGTIKIDNSNFTRSNLRSNVDFKINKYLNASLNLSGRVEHRNSPPARITGNDSDILQTIARVYPIYKPYANNDPMYYGTTNIPSANTLAMSSENGGYNKSSWGVFNASGILEYTLPL